MMFRHTVVNGDGSTSFRAIGIIIILHYACLKTEYE
jgi:hypothetical protein